MNKLVKIIEDYDGEVEESEQRWHAMVFTDTNRTACGIALDSASRHVVEEKAVKRGGITCRHCVNTILDYKGIKL